MSVINVPKMTKTAKMITLICALALAVRAGNPDTNTPMEADADPSTNTSSSPSIKLLFEDQSAALETVECLKDFKILEELFGYLKMTHQELSDTIESADGVKLPHINNLEDYARFKALWVEKALVKQDQETGKIGLVLNFLRWGVAQAKAWWWKEADLTADEFNRFFSTAEFLIIDGEARQRFAARMVRRGLLGKHSANIRAQCTRKTPGRRDLARWMLLALAKQAGLEASVDANELLFYPADPEYANDPEVIMPNLKDATDAEDIIAKVKKIRLAGCISASNDKKTAVRATVFGWLLSYVKLRLVSVDFGTFYSETDPSLDPPAGLIGSLKQDLIAITQPHGKKPVVVVSIALMDYALDFETVTALMDVCPHLKDVRMVLEDQLDENDVESLSEFSNLESVCIRGKFYTSSFINQLADKMPNLKKVELELESHTEGDTMDFSRCSRLEELVIKGNYQDSSFVQQLVESVPEIKELTILVGRLDVAIVASFAKCLKLKKLEFPGKDQSGSFVSQLLQHIPAVDTLFVDVDALNSDLGAALSSCSHLQKLNLGGKELSPGFFVSTLKVPLLNSLKELWANRVIDIQEPSAEDSEAIARAEANGIAVKVELE